MRRYFHTATLGGVCSFDLSDPARTPTYPDIATAAGIDNCNMSDWNWGAWARYYMALKQKFGKQQAIFLTNQDMDATVWNSTIRQPWNADCGIIRALNKEWEGSGYEIHSIITDVYCATSGATTDLTQFASSVTGTVSSAGSGAESVVSTISKLAPVLIIGAAALGGYYLYKKVKK